MRPAASLDLLLSASPEPRLPSGRKRALVALAGLGMLAYVGAAIVTDYPALERAMRQLGWAGTALILGTSLFNYVLRFLRWHWFLHDLGHTVTIGHHLLIYLGGFLFTVSPAKAGEAVRGLYLREQDVPYADTFAALFVERLLDFMAYALLATLIAFQYPEYRGFLAGAFVLAFALLVAAGQPALPAWLDRLAAGRGAKLAGLFTMGANLLRSSKQMLRPALLLPGLAIGLLAWGAEGIGFHLLCEGMGLNVPPLTATSIYAIAGLAGAATFFMPGGIGGMEVVMTALLTALGAPLALAVIATLLCRLATLWFAVLIGFFATAALELRGLRPATDPLA
jgi:glycosyltransferase 2 family protein